MDSMLVNNMLTLLTTKFFCVICAQKTIHSHSCEEDYWCSYFETVRHFVLQRNMESSIYFYLNDHE